MHFNTAKAYLWSRTIDVCRANVSSVLKVSRQTNHWPINSFPLYLETKQQLITYVYWNGLDKLRTSTYMYMQWTYSELQAIKWSLIHVSFARDTKYEGEKSYKGEKSSTRRLAIYKHHAL